ncbi:MAG: hypothetical protein OSB57_01920 [Planctomycetota bacterium]|nr:hypothetical protein [Planctomycetota bacterium]
MSASPTSRSLALLREREWTAAVVEKWIPQTKRRKDLFNCIDIVAVQIRGGTLGVQACAVSGQAAHVKKLLAEPNAKTWLLAGNRLSIWAWKKYAKPVDRKFWRVTETEITLGMF